MADTTDERPNVLLLHPGDMGQYIGCYGNAVETPNMDALAADGVRFENSFCTAPQCSPSRGSIMTGRHPHRNGLMGLVNFGWELPESERALPELLRQGGYSTYLIGAHHEVEEPARLGYDYLYTESQHAPDVADHVEATVDEMASSAPFFASVGFFEPHRPYRSDSVPEAAYDTYDPDGVEPPPYLPDAEGVREDLADLQSLLTTTVDPAVGRITDALRAAGIEEETVVVLTTDHGIAMPRAKGMCYDPGVRTALVVRCPGRYDGGETRTELVSNVDLLPTFLDLGGVDAPSNLDGRSFRPLLADEGYDHREELFVGITWHGRYNPVRGVRTDRYKYVRNFWKSPRVYLPGDVFSGKAGREVRDEYHVDDRPQEELYDLREDPNEQHNLASDERVYDAREDASAPDPAYEETLDSLRTRLDEWMRETDDPLLDGPVPPAER
jgi:arylsulfatase A-like enzyme